MTIEHRRHARINHAVHLIVMIRPEQEYTLEMQNFSESGLYIVTVHTSSGELGKI
jgi:hypothetical protein